MRGRLRRRLREECATVGRRRRATSLWASGGSSSEPRTESKFAGLIKGRATLARRAGQAERSRSVVGFGRRRAAAAPAAPTSAGRSARRARPRRWRTPAVAGGTLRDATAGSRWVAAAVARCDGAGAPRRRRWSRERAARAPARLRWRRCSRRLITSAAAVSRPAPPAAAAVSPARRRRPPRRPPSACRAVTENQRQQLAPAPRAAVPRRPALQRVEAVLDRVVGAADERLPLDDLAPARAELGDADEDRAVVLVAEVRLLHLGAQVVVPPLAALLADAARLEVRGDHRPPAGAVLGDGGDERLVLLGLPRPLHKVRRALGAAAHRRRCRGSAQRRGERSKCHAR